MLCIIFEVHTIINIWKITILYDYKLCFCRSAYLQQFLPFEQKAKPRFQPGYHVTQFFLKKNWD